MKPNLVIYGIGAMAKTYASYLQDKYNIVGYAIESKLKTSNEFNKLPLYDFEKLSHTCSTKEHVLIVAVGYVEMNSVREKISKLAKEQGYRLASYVDASIRHHADVSIGDNSVAFEHSSIHCGSKVGNNVFISSGVHIGHDCEIGDNVWINSGVCLAGGVKIASNTFIGMNATISHNVTIGKNSFIGASTLVNSSTDINSVVISPAGESISMNSQTFLRFSKVMNHV